MRVTILKSLITIFLLQGYLLSKAQTEEGFSGYLFVYFTADATTGEQIRFALSSDGYTYRALNGNKPVISSSKISLTGGVRDPHIYRGPDSTFYMVATDMMAANGWESNRGIVLMKSKNLIDWSSATVNIPTVFPDEFSTITRAWAPQSIYDNVAKKMMVYFSMKRPNEPDIIYYSYANDDFTALATTPKQLFFSPSNSACIDADILYKDSVYNLFFKTEGSGNGIKKATSKKLTEGYVIYNKYLDQSNLPVEGAGTFKLINSDTYILMYDVYMSGKYEFTQSRDLVNFSVVKEPISMDFAPRHGTIMPITKEEAKALVKKWGKNSNLNILSAKSKFVKTQNIAINTTAATVYIPVIYGTKLDSLDPEFMLTPGVQISPTIPQDFTKGAVDYTVAIEGVGSKTFKVIAEVNNNPIIQGFYADPEVLYSKKTGKYYIYPTSDGFTDWTGNYFKAFSSTDLYNWTDEGVILNLPTDVKWASTNAWAPTIIEKEIGGEYKYYFYFCAATKIGVAVSDNPTGPFTDSGKAIISSTPAGAGGQQIDPDVFFDPESGKNYLFWGSSYMARAELNDDMVSIKTGTIKVITPDNTYREGTEVFLREGKYYFLWSENDTRSADYRVRYGYSDSPTGTLTIPKNNLVISRNNSLGIYGTGHNCVLHVPDSNKYYIIYHRFNRPKGISMGDAAGYNREVCIDELRFNEDGTIKQVVPSLKGFGADSIEIIDAVFNKKYSSSIKIYPNPGKYAINISTAENLSGNKMIKVFDSTARIILEKSLNSSEAQIDISMLTAGVYIMELSQSTNKIGSCRFIVK